MDIPDSARGGIFKYMGGKTDEFLSAAAERLKKYSDLWRLSNLSYMQTNTINLLYACDSDLYGECVLKLCILGPEVATEINCLLAYDGKGYCKLWEYSLNDDLLLLEKVTPGDQMWAVADYRERARLMALTVKDLPIAYKGPDTYPTYLTWMEDIHRKLSQAGGMDEMIAFLDIALDAYSGMKNRYNRVCLLHGDLHQENMLLNSDGGYTIIDPKGVTDDPVMETARFLMNETPCDESKIMEMAAIMSPILGIPAGDILKSMFVDAALSHCWTMEEHFTSPGAFEAAMVSALDICRFVFDLAFTPKNKKPFGSFRT